MLTEIDPRVLARVNLYAVLGSLPRLAELAPRSAEHLGRLDRPVTLTMSVAGGPKARLIFDSDGIRAGHEPSGTVAARLLFRSAQHLNAVIDGSAQPIPVAGPRGLRFLTQVFTPLSELLSEYLQPTEAALADPAIAEASTLLTLNVAVRAIIVVGNHDRSGRFSAQQMPDGDIDLEVGDLLRYRIRVRDHRLGLARPTLAAPRAVFAFADLDTLGGVLSGRDSALACVASGRLAMRGYIPLVDNINRILDRVGHYLGK